MITHYYNAKILVVKYLIQVLKNDAYIKGIVGTRIYTTHISQVRNPVFPCITLAESSGSQDPGIAEIGQAELDLDIWSKRSREEITQIYASVDSNSRQIGIAPLLTNQVFDYPEVTIYLVREILFKNDFFEPRSMTYRALVRYRVNFAAKKVTV